MRLIGDSPSPFGHLVFTDRLKRDRTTVTHIDKSLSANFRTVRT
ncbi:hypothetical protein VARIO8X_50596 [Burkholderiales bacterium 8X]|nr:hypothetical protein VARIO8X_50596 [Burkholderiales bacterium 8X]